jgi:hypothetical protein
MNVRSVSLALHRLTDPASNVKNAGNAPSAEACAVVQNLMHELLPGPQVSRQEFLGLRAEGVELCEADLTDMISLIVGTWALEKSRIIETANHKMYAAQSFDDFEQRYLELAEEHFGGNETLTAALLTSIQRAGVCGGHEARNYVLIGSLLHQLWLKHPCLREHIPVVARVCDPDASTRVKGASSENDAHVYLLMGPRSAFVDSRGMPKVVSGDGQKRVFAVDSTYPFSFVFPQSRSPFKVGQPTQIYDVNSDASAGPSAWIQGRDDVPMAWLDELNKIDERPAPAREPGDCGVERNWRFIEDSDDEDEGRRKMPWQAVHACEPGPRQIHVCGDLRFDADQLREDGLKLQESRLLEASEALENGGRSPLGTPRRGVPPFTTKNSDE